MSKAILIIDMPKSCNECKIRCDDEYSNWCPYDNPEPNGVFQYVKNGAKPEWCPLKPMPEKIDVPDWDDSIKAKNENAEEVGMYMYDRGHYRGYNICIDKILGE